MDYNVDNYSINELLEIIEVKIPATKENIEEKTDELISKYEDDKEDPLYKFFINVKEKLLTYIFQHNDTQINQQGFGMETYLTKKFDSEMSEVIGRTQQNIVLMDPNHSIMKRKRLNFPNAEVEQGYMNPVYKSTRSLLLNIDSHYRQNLSSSSTDFIIDLSEPIKDVLSMHIYEYEIPANWYVFNEAYGTNSILIDSSKVTITEGNYTPDELITEISGQLLETCGSDFTISLNPINNRIYIDNSANDFSMTPYDVSSTNISCEHSSSGGKIDYNLGWLLGYRETSYTDASGYLTEGLINTVGPRYIFIELDDYTKNRMNNEVISVYDANNEFIKLPNYYNCDLSGSGTSTIDESNPRKLTTAQIYTINEIKNYQNTPRPNRHLGNTNADIIARISNNRNNKEFNFDMIYSEKDRTEEYKRVYLGPTTISRIHVRLIDDKGNVINLNNSDWSFSLLINQLYQY